MVEGGEPRRGIASYTIPASVDGLSFTVSDENARFRFTACTLE